MYSSEQLQIFQVNDYSFDKASKYEPGTITHVVRSEKWGIKFPHYQQAFITTKRIMWGYWVRRLAVAYEYAKAKPELTALIERYEDPLNPSIPGVDKPTLKWPPLGSKEPVTTKSAKVNSYIHQSLAGDKSFSRLTRIIINAHLASRLDFLCELSLALGFRVDTFQGYTYTPTCSPYWLNRWASKTRPRGQS